MKRNKSFYVCPVKIDPFQCWEFRVVDAKIARISCPIFESVRSEIFLDTCCSRKDCRVRKWSCLYSVLCGFHPMSDNLFMIYIYILIPFRLFVTFSLVVINILSTKLLLQPLIKHTLMLKPLYLRMKEMT